MLLDATSKPVPGQLNSPPKSGQLNVLSAYAWTEDPRRIATSAASGLLTTLRADFRQVIVAVPPVLSNPVASAVSECVDAVVLLVSQGKSKRRQVARVAEALRATGAPLAGIVLVVNSGRLARSAARRARAARPYVAQSDSGGKHEYVS